MDDALDREQEVAEVVIVESRRRLRARFASAAGSTNSASASRRRPRATSSCSRGGARARPRRASALDQRSRRPSTPVSTRYSVSRPRCTRRDPTDHLVPQVDSTPTRAASLDPRVARAQPHLVELHDVARREVGALADLGDDLIRPTSAAWRTVPAPTSTLSPNRFASRSMLFRGSGELSGTSMILDAPFVNGIADRVGLFRLDAAGDRDQWALGRDSGSAISSRS